MGSRAVDLKVAGMTCRVVTSAADDELAALAGMVEQRIAGVLKPGRPVTTQAILLAAISLANEVNEERARTRAVADRARTTLARLIDRVDDVLATDGEGKSAGEPVDRSKVSRAAPDAPARRPMREGSSERQRELFQVERSRTRLLDDERGSE